MTTMQPVRWSNRVGMARRVLDAVHALEFTVERISTTQLALDVSDEFRRTTTVVELHDGDERTGRGEDVAYTPDTQAELPAAYNARTDLIGDWTMASWAAHLDANPVELPHGQRMNDKPGFQRWALEAAALDLALQQRETNLAELVATPWNDVLVSLSLGLGSPPSVDVLRAWLTRDERVTFKLDVGADWDAELIEQQLGEFAHAIPCIDIKALYTGDWANFERPPALYAMLGRDLPTSLLEDAKLDPEVRDALDEDALMRLTWDYPITAPEDVPGLATSHSDVSDLRPAAINIKPSRFGSMTRLLETVALCDDEHIPCYAGGQFELGVGRTQVQTIASLCFPDAPNDCAPVLFHGASPDDDVPLGPVALPAHRGFGWDAPTRAERT